MITVDVRGNLADAVMLWTSLCGCALNAELASAALRGSLRAQLRARKRRFTEARVPAYVEAESPVTLDSRSQTTPRKATRRSETHLSP